MTDSSDISLPLWKELEPVMSNEMHIAMKQEITLERIHASL